MRSSDSEGGALKRCAKVDGDRETNGSEDASAARSASGHRVTGVLAHHVYGGARPGSLHNVYVRVAYADGSRSDGFVPSDTLGPSHKALLDYMRRRKEGQKIVKYLPPELQDIVERK